MFKGFTQLLEKTAFWFVFTCSLCLTYSVLMAVMFGELPGKFVALLDTFAILWCFFAGTLPMLYLGWTKIKTWFDTKFMPMP